MNGGAGFDPTMISTISDSVDGAVANWHEQTIKKQAFAASGPCEGAVCFAELAANWIGPISDDVNSAAAGLAAWTQGAVEASIRAKGEAAAGVVGGQSLTEYVLSQVGGNTSRLVPPGAADPFSIRAYVRDRLPDGSDILAARQDRWSSNAGAQLSAGVYLSGGRYTGTTIRDWVQDWVAYQVSAASPAIVPESRSLLGSLVGTWTGSSRIGGWSAGIWSAADGGRPGSKLARINFILDDAYSIREDLQRECSSARGAALFSGKARDILPFVAIGAALFLVASK